MTLRQKQAYEWLVVRGKASERSVRAAGFTTRTFDSLVDQGLATRELRFAGSDSFMLYRA